MADVGVPFGADRTPTPTGLRAWLTIAAMVAHVALGLAIIALLFPFANGARQRDLIRWWSGRILAILRAELRVVAPTRASAENAATIADAMRVGGRGAMLVMNHVSWLDIFVVHSLRPAHFIAKAEIARWPLLGFLVARTGTVFIERGKRHAVREVNQRVATMLRDDELVGVFPEGTTGDGDRVLPFHANLIQPAIDAGAPIVAAAVRYRDADGGTTSATLYTGDIDIFQSLRRIARHPPIVAELRFIDVLDGTGLSRHEVGRRARALVVGALGFDDGAREIDDALSTLSVNPAEAPAGTRPGTPVDPRDELL